MLPLRDHASLNDAERVRLERLLGRMRTLEETLGLFRAQSPSPRLVEIIAQDEYTHDVVFGLDERRYLVFDATWLGALTAVAVWDHRPEADELLAERLGRGWRPTPTDTVDGPQVLGHAARCALPPIPRP